VRRGWGRGGIVDPAKPSVERGAGDAEILADVAAWDLEELHEPQDMESLNERIAGTTGVLADVLSQDRDLQLELVDAVSQEGELGFDVVRGANGKGSERPSTGSSSPPG
jgi:hypothetical protein